MTRHLTARDLIDVHAEFMGRAGRWPARLLKREELVTLLLRVRDVERDADADVVHLGALLAVGLVQLRPFEDGNPTTAFAALIAFLGLNGRSPRSGTKAELSRYRRIIAEEHEESIAVRLFESKLRANLRPVE